MKKIQEQKVTTESSLEYNKWSLIGILITVLVNPFNLNAQQETIDTAVRKYESEIIEIRHHLHQNPELGNREFNTAKLIAEHLRKLGMEVTTGIAHTGVVGLLRGGRSGPVVAARADMDALPVTEDTPFTFKSRVRTTYLGKEVGVMHACGHDIHTSVLLGTASVMASMRDEIPGTIKFIFQPAEEGEPPGEEGGAELLFKEGVLENPSPSAIFGLHSMPEMDVGRVGFTVGPALASVDHFIVTLRGKQAHGAEPHFSIDPIVMGSQAVMAFQTIRSRTLPPLEPSVITVGIFRSGERFNIIPEEARLEGTVRTYNEDVRNEVEKRMHEILEGITKAYGGTYGLDYNREMSVTINDPGLAEKMLPTVERVLGKENVLMLEPAMAGEDFSVFANKIPGFYFRLGTTKPGTVSGSLHNPTFQADDSSIGVGMRVMSNLLLDYLKSGGM